MHNILRRDIEDEILPYCQEQDIEMIVYSPMASGLLTGKITRERTENTPPDNWRRNAENFQELKPPVTWTSSGTCARSCALRRLARRGLDLEASGSTRYYVSRRLAANR